MLEELTEQLEQKADLTPQQMSQAFQAMLAPETADEEIALFLLALARKGETAVEVAAAAQAVRQRMTVLKTQHTSHLDTCGTGGDGLSTFNISTAAAVVAAACGVVVAKHGNRSVTSKSGSADVLARLGVNIDAELPVVERCLDQLGLCFCFAPIMHPALKRVSLIRRQLGVPTIFNWLGPLCNPALAPYQLMGVGKPHLRRLVAEVHQLLGTPRAVIVCGADGLDEVSLETETYVSVATPETIEEKVWTPEDFGVARAPIAQLRVDGPEESAQVINQVFQGAPGPARDIVVANAAAAVWTVDPDRHLSDCAQQAGAAIDSGRVQELLGHLSACSVGAAGDG